jgi:hypothetical protein
MAKTTGLSERGWGGQEMPGWDQNERKSPADERPFNVPSYTYREIMSFYIPPDSSSLQQRSSGDPGHRWGFLAPKTRPQHNLSFILYSVSIQHTIKPLL